MDKENNEINELQKQFSNAAVNAISESQNIVTEINKRIFSAISNENLDNIYKWLQVYNDYVLSQKGELWANEELNDNNEMDII